MTPFWTKYVPARADNRTGVTFNMNDLPARIDPARRLIEDLRQPEHPARLRRRAPAARRLARRAPAPRCDPGRLPRRAARRRTRFVERLDGGRRGVLPRKARRSTYSRRRADRSGPGRLPADRQRSRSRSGTTVRGFGLGCRARDLPPAASARTRRRVRPSRPRAGTGRCRDRRAAVHGRDAA